MMLSKTELLIGRAVRFGQVFANVCAKTSIDTSGISDYVYQGNTFFGVSNESTVVVPVPWARARLGAPYSETAANTNINASEFDFIRQGSPFWVTFSGPPPVITYNMAQFFAVF